MLYYAESLSLSDMSGFCCQAGAGTGLSRAFPLSPEFIVIHNGIITNYKDLQKFLVSDPWGGETLPPFPLPFALTPFPAHSPSCILTLISHLHSTLALFLHSHCSTHSSLISDSDFPTHISSYLHSCSHTHIFSLPPIFALPLLPLHSQTLPLCEYILTFASPIPSLPHSHSPHSPTHILTFTLTTLLTPPTSTPSSSPTHSPTETFPLKPPPFVPPTPTPPHILTLTSLLSRSHSMPSPPLLIFLQFKRQEGWKESVERGKKER